MTGRYYGNLHSDNPIWNFRFKSLNGGITVNLSSLQSAYAIVLNLDKTNLSLPYDEALSKICDVMDSFQFKPLTNNIYVCTSSKNQLALLYMLVQELSKITWLKPSLVTLKAFKMDNISDFTDIIKGK